MNIWTVGTAYLSMVVIVLVSVCLVGKNYPPIPKEEDDWQAQEITRLYRARIAKKQGGMSEAAQTILALLVGAILLWAIEHWHIVMKFFHAYMTAKF
ncbi:MAG: hypothetical protein WAZ40_00690 [Minisyncoccia bacterium]